MSNKVILMILDGWGLGNHSHSDAIYTTGPKCINYFMQQYPNSKLITCGEDVGLPVGQMGNSEVGHLNIGAGRVVYQDLVRINKAISDNSISDNSVLLDAFEYAKNNNKAVHFVGLVSDGGVHSKVKHLYKLCDITKNLGLKKVFVHAFTDGRDSDPKSGYKYLSDLYDYIKGSDIQVATVSGRYYGMDRDKRWERVKVAYDLLTNSVGTPTHDPLKMIQKSYESGVTDEFIKPLVVLNNHDEPVAKIEPGDVVICFNYRTDRLRELTTVLSQKDMSDFDMKALKLYYLTMTRYDDSFENVHVIYDKDNLKNTLGEVLSNAKKHQIRIAETEKYAHVTFFFSGGREEPFVGEQRILIPSPKVATYDLQPEMSAFKITEAIKTELDKGDVDFVCLNFANGDMIGHTGVYAAIQKAVLTVDQCVCDVTETARKNGYNVLITADHGNADYATNEDGSPNTAHSLNPVPFIVIADGVKSVHDGVLADIAPTVLDLMGIEQHPDMTGKSLIER